MSDKTISYTAEDCNCSVLEFYKSPGDPTHWRTRVTFRVTPSGSYTRELILTDDQAEAVDATLEALHTAAVAVWAAE